MFSKNRRGYIYLTFLSLILYANIKLERYIWEYLFLACFPCLVIVFSYKRHRLFVYYGRKL